MSATHAHPHRVVGRALVVAVLVVYLVLLVWLVVWKLNEPFVGTAADRHLKLIPFVATSTAGASRPIEVIGNVLVFVPYGILLGLLRPSRPWLSTAAIAATSCAFEIAQYVLAVGVTDTSDVIANTAGGALGLVLARLALAVSAGGSGGARGR